MKVIFLDFDGVLNTVGYNRELGEVTFGGTTTTLDNPHAINMVQALVDFTGAKVVVSSSWRCMGLERVKAVLAKSNLHCDVIGITPELGGERGLEIQAWLDTNSCLNVEEFVILDDDSDMAHLIDKLVRCEPLYGFAVNEFYSALDILNYRGSRVYKEGGSSRER